MNRNLTVIPVDSQTNLTVSTPGPEGIVNCTGSVMANFPVKSASVQIVWDQTHIIVTKTDANGLFMREIELSPGRHTIIAGFSDEGFPINPSESEPRVVDISLIRGLETDYGQLLSVIAIVGIFIFFIAAAAFYLKRMSRKKTPVSGTARDAEYLPEADSELPHTGSKDTIDNSQRSKEETLIAYYSRLLGEQGLSAASWRIYQQLAWHIARDLRIKQHRALTAREMSRTCRGKPYYGVFARFVSVYERIRYGGIISVKDQAVFEAAINATDEQIGGEKH